MRIRIRQSLYRDRYGVVHHAGDIAELPEHVGAKLIGYGIAEPVREAAIPEPRERPAAKTKPKPKASKSSRPAKEEAE